jgi:phosphate acyltransferase
MRIGLDMMGGDYAPKEAVLGVQGFLNEAAFQNGIVFAIGKKEILDQELAGISSERCVVIDAPEEIGMNEHPTKALKEKPNSSIAIGFHLLATNKIDAFISAGNTGAMLVGATFVIKPIDGVQRPTIPTLVPNINGGHGLLLDVGINADCKPEYLEQFAVLGSNYAEHVLGIKNPKVGLLNIGEEEGKGNLLAKATFPLLKENQHINFVGNIEGRDLFMGKADVVVCEGFTGNIVLKLSESIYHIFGEQRKIKDDYLNQFNYESYGGTPVLGVNKTVIVGHGISTANAFNNMLQQAYKIASSNLPEHLKGKFTAINE